MRRLLPEAGPTDPATELGDYRPFDRPHPDRPWVAVNMVTTVDGRASVNGRSKDLGSRTDTELLLGLRSRFDAVMIGAGTMRAERYGRIISDPRVRAERERIGLARDPLAVIISGKLDLPFDAPLFTDGGGRVLIFTSSGERRPETATPLQLVSMGDEIELEPVLEDLRHERGIRALLCEGGPQTFGQLIAGGLVDELFLTVTPTITGDDAPRILEWPIDGTRPLELISLSESDGELYARYQAT
jgi:riboflavin-specific deaminase-like protein